MGAFLRACVRQVNRHGLACSFVQVTEGLFDPETLTTTNTETTFAVKMFKNHLKATQYNYPNLVGKDAAEFYLANYNISFKPTPKDKIVYGTDTYTVDAVKENWASGELCLYQIIAVKG
jgi:hypothetical protein